MTRKQDIISREELRRIIKRYGGVDRFAALVPVEPRTVWYWLAGRKMHPVFIARVRAMAKEQPTLSPGGKVK